MPSTRWPTLCTTCWRKCVVRAAKFVRQWLRSRPESISWSTFEMSALQVSFFPLLFRPQSSFEMKRLLLSHGYHLSVNVIIKYYSKGLHWVAFTVDVNTQHFVGKNEAKAKVNFTCENTKTFSQTLYLLKHYLT